MWSDKTHWKESWREKRSIKGGGQADCRIVELRSDPKVICFLKTPKKNTKHSLVRFAREAYAYAQIDHPSFPALIDSNAHLPSNRSNAPYLVTTYIPGPTLNKFIEDQGSLKFDDALVLTLKLLKLIKHLHQIGFVHRDVKPRNIILRNCAPSDPVLLDLGLVHGLKATAENEEEFTMMWEELGNRFLRLPELAPGSVAKVDSRSDLAFAGAVLFYAITSMEPGVPSDANGDMPHQRKNASQALAALSGNQSRILRFFDKVFARRIQDRFQDADEMIEALENMRNNSKNDDADDIDQLQREIAEHIAGTKNAELIKVRKSLNDGINEVAAIAHDVVQTTNGLYATITSGSGRSNTAHHLEYGYFHSGDPSKTVVSKITATGVGNELVIAVGETELLRTDLFEPQFSSDFKERARVFYARALLRLMEEN